MIYLAALFLPPLALGMCKRPVQAAINALIGGFGLVLALLSLGILFPVSFALWSGCVLHALLVAASHQADQRNQRLLAALNNSQQNGDPE